MKNLHIIFLVLILTSCSKSVEVLENKPPTEFQLNESDMALISQQEAIKTKNNLMLIYEDKFDSVPAWSKVSESHNFVSLSEDEEKQVFRICREMLHDVYTFQRSRFLNEVDELSNDYSEKYKKLIQDSNSLIKEYDNDELTSYIQMYYMASGNNLLLLDMTELNDVAMYAFYRCNNGYNIYFDDLLNMTRRAYEGENFKVESQDSLYWSYYQRKYDYTLLFKNKELLDLMEAINRYEGNIRYERYPEWLEKNHTTEPPTTPETTDLKKEDSYEEKEEIIYDFPEVQMNKQDIYAYTNYNPKMQLFLSDYKKIGLVTKNTSYTLVINEGKITDILPTLSSDTDFNIGISMENLKQLFVYMNEAKYTKAAELAKNIEMPLDIKFKLVKSLI